MKKRGRRWMWAGVGAVVVALVVLALVFRERPPYEFLQGAERVRTTVGARTAHFPPYSITTYFTELSPDEVGEIARKELEPQGWDCLDRTFHAPGLAAEVWTGRFGPAQRRRAWDERLLGKTYVSTSRPATSMDRFNAWLDRVMGR